MSISANIDRCLEIQFCRDRTKAEGTRQVTISELFFISDKKSAN